LELEEAWAKTLAAAVAGKPGTIKGPLLSEDKSQRYKLLADLIAAIDEAAAAQRLSIDGWLNRNDYKRQLLPESSVHDLEWHSSTEVNVGWFELHLSAAR